jgi:hypothetical protein
MSERKQYKNPLTLDGKVKLHPSVSLKKVQAVKAMAEATMAGDRQAKGALEESITTSDAIFNYAALVNANVLPDFDLPERTWSQVAGTRTVSDFRAPTLYSLVPEYNPGVLGTGTPRHVLPVVPEATAYPYATLEGEVYQLGGIEKRGVKAGFSMEAWINDSIGALQAIPESFRRIALDTEEYEVYSALIAGVGAGQQLDGGTVPTGTTVAANSPLSRDALIRAIYELSQRQINGRPVRVSGSYNLIVPVGQAVFANFILNQTLGEIRTTPGTPADTQFVYGVNGYNPLQGITVIESEYVTGTAWYLVPKQGTTGGRPVLELLRLAGHELPEIRVHNDTGVLVGGGAISPFEGSFNNDTADFRIRSIGRGILWTADLVVWSTGAGS